jgi:large subunit ribosomal protein L1
MPKHGKRYKAQAEQVEKGKVFAPITGLQLVKDMANAKFDETVEVSIRLGVDTRKADQNVRGSISLPHGTGKEVRVAVFAEGEKAREAEEAGAEAAAEGSESPRQRKRLKQPAQRKLKRIRWRQRRKRIRN